MLETTTGIVVGNTIQLSGQLNLPDNTQVRITVQPLPPEGEPPISAWERTKARLRERPIHGEGRRYTREELHERH
jgi:hypothetical protein